MKLSEIQYAGPKLSCPDCKESAFNADHEFIGQTRVNDDGDYHMVAKCSCGTQYKRKHTMLMNEVLDEALTIPVVVKSFYCHDKNGGDCNNLRIPQCKKCREMEARQ